jgi:hypothetical protein
MIRRWLSKLDMIWDDIWVKHLILIFYSWARRNCQKLSFWGTQRNYHLKQSRKNIPIERVWIITFSYVDQKFLQSYKATVGADFMEKEVFVDGKAINLEVFI